MEHDDIWRAIDKVAKDNGLSVSALARKAGLNSTTFNKSKRFSKDGKKRWPTMESIAKVLNNTNYPLKSFVDEVTSKD